MYSVINGIPTLLCFMFVIWNVCLKDLVKKLFCSIVRVGTRNNWIFPELVKLDSWAVAYLLDVLEDINFECKIYFSFYVGMFFIFDIESIKKSVSRSGD